MPLFQSERASSDPVKKKRVFHTWVLVKKFENASLAQEMLQQENIWSIHYSNDSEEGKKIYYRCNKVKKRRPQCSAKRYLLYDSLSSAVFLYRTEDDHDHEYKESAERGLSEIVKEEVNKLLEFRLKPKDIMAALSKIEGLKLPKMTQLRTYIAERRRLLYNQQDNSALPENLHCDSIHDFKSETAT